jgi:two-component system OmpR family response regulator
VNLLLVDDSEISLERIGRAVAAARPEVAIVKASTFADGLTAFQKLRPELVVLDTRLPDGDGYELLKLLKSDSPQARVVMLSSEPVDRCKCLDAGADFFFDKAKEFDAFIEAVRKMV